MGSFVPLGGFFSMPSKHEILHTTATQSLPLCTMCNEKYEKEVSAVLRGDSNKSAIDQHSINLSPWLQVAPCQTSKRSDIIESKNDKSILDAKVMAIQRKWNEICQQLHFSWTSQEDTSPAKSQTSSACCTSSPSVISVTTDLGLGTLYASEKESSEKKLDLQERYNVIQDFSESSRTHEYIPNQLVQSSSSSHKLEKQIYTKDLELPWKVLAEKIYWQTEAIQTISQTISRCSNKRNIWLSFVGPDKVAKRKIATAVAEIVFGKKEHMVSFDLTSQNVISPSYSIFDIYDTKYHGMISGRKMIVDYLAEALSKCSQSVVLLENIEKADFLVQNSLSQAVKIGKFQDSHGRDININNKVFILTSRFLKGHKDLFGQVESEFSEEKVLEAKHFQMQLSVRTVDENHSRYSSTNVSVTPSEKLSSSQCPVNKRKFIKKPTKADMSKRRLSRSIIDLNMPVEDTEDDTDIDICYDEDDDESSENSKVWLDELLEHVDENVVFIPFDFDFIAQNILKDINMRLKRVVGAGTFLEIDREVLVQILAAAWLTLTDGKNEFEDWIERVLCSSIKKARQNFNVTSDLVMKLVPCDGVLVAEQAYGVYLPARINLN
ncbi:hypothetical protein BUALT_BualtUnG0013800 [Buddleja alternifolia]|uniref:ATPase AAA-type core domain-containing protein n=1 Tax=Buddleja alternifolia TaxID=168488 RepID=A0AAV6W5H6_9LAMI|nr:hypothetical protein BUALT_BualtUnG0013800 [Buddleja alternifolia]